MEISPTRLVAACVAIFGGIVAINMIAQLREREDIKERLSSLDLNTLVPTLRRQEMMEPPEYAEDLLRDLNREDEPVVPSDEG